MLESELISNEASGGPIDFEEIQKSNKEGPTVETNTPPEFHQPVKKTNIIPTPHIYNSNRVHPPPNRC